MYILLLSGIPLQAYPSRELHLVSAFGVGIKPTLVLMTGCTIQSAIVKSALLSNLFIPALLSMTMFVATVTRYYEKSEWMVCIAITQEDKQADVDLFSVCPSHTLSLLCFMHIKLRMLSVLLQKID